MHWSFYIALVTVCFVSYATLNRAFADGAPAIHGAIALMGTGTCLLLLLAVFVDKQPVASFSTYLPYMLMGILVSGINAGYVYAFSLGAPVGIAPGIVNIISTVILAVIGYIIFKEELSVIQMLGIAFGVVSIGLIAKG